MTEWMIYGVSGYTGRLCAEEAVSRGMRPVVAGRGRYGVEAAAAELGLPCRVFSLSDPEATREGLHGMDAVLNCAGPFSATARPMLEGCMATGTHYLDVTGEITVFEYVRRHDTRWKEGGIAVIPGVGFDVVPTDCMAAMLKRALPGATHLRLAFRSDRGKLSPGTTKTIIEGMGEGCVIRRRGHLERIPLASLTAEIPFASGTRLATAIPWGDVSTAFLSTDIPNIEVYTVLPEKQVRQMRFLNHIRFALGWRPVQNRLKRWVDKHVEGPDEEERCMDNSELYGDATESGARRVAMAMQTPNGYSLTHDAAISAVARLLAETVPAGAQTPSMAFGDRFVLGLRGVRCSQPAAVPLQE